MKRKFVGALLVAFLLVFQLTPLAYAAQPDTATPAAEVGQQSVREFGEQPLDGIDVGAVGAAADGAADTAAGATADTAADAAAAAEAVEMAEAAEIDDTQALSSAATNETTDTTSSLITTRLEEAVATAEAELSITLKITGLAVIDGFVEPVAWASEENHTVDSSTSILDLTTAFLTQKGLDHEVNYGMLQAITSGGVTLGMASSANGYSYWECYRNGVSYGGNPSTDQPQNGEVWEWRYNDGAQAAFADQCIEVKITGVETVGGASVYVPWLVSTKYYDTSVSALAASCAVLEKNAMAYTLAYGDTFLDSITKANGSLTLGSTSSGGDFCYWEFFVNGAASSQGAAQTSIQAGDVLEFRYFISGSDAPVEVVTTPDAPRPNYSADNAGFINNRVVSSPTPSDAGATELAFKSTLKDPSDWQTNCSDPLLVGGNIYVAIGQALVVFDGATGARIAVTTKKTIPQAPARARRLRTKRLRISRRLPSRRTGRAASADGASPTVGRMS